METKKRTRGRPPKYQSTEEMQRMIDAYFEKCSGKMVTKTDPATGEETPLLDKNMQPVVVNERPPTVTGLALALGFASRQALLNYQARDAAFNNLLTRAKSRVEEYAETRLYDKDGLHGAKFTLANNFSGWKEKQEVGVVGREDEPFIVDIKIIE